MHRSTLEGATRMTITLIAVLVLVTFLVLALLGTPLAYSMIASAGMGLVMLDGTTQTGYILASEPYSATASYFLMLIPLKIFLGMLVQKGGLAQDVYLVASRVLRRLPGGVGLATVAACAGFAAVSGSSVATVATIGRASIGEMRRYGYSPQFAAGLVAAGGTLGALIPPSVSLVIYGILTGLSIGALLTAGLIPALVVASVYAAYIMITQRRSAPVPVGPEHASSSNALVAAGHPGSSHASQPRALPPNDPGPGHAAGDDSPDPLAGDRPARKERVPYESALYIAVLFFILLCGLYSGLFTIIEAGAIGTVVALVIVIGRAIARGESIRDLVVSSLVETTNVMSMIFALLVGGSLLATFFVSTRLPITMADWAAGLDMPPLLLLIILLLILLPLGMVLDPLSIMLITVPIYHPLVTGLGFDGIWFAILFMRMMEIAMITPPVGLNVFVVSGVVKDISVEEAFKGAAPFVGLDLLTVGLFIAVPGIVTFLPSYAGF
jgi:C4-dicarboxylate transporter, DctM subunit